MRSCSLPESWSSEGPSGAAAAAIVRRWFDVRSVPALSLMTFFIMLGCGLWESEIGSQLQSPVVFGNQYFGMTVDGFDFPTDGARFGTMIWFAEGGEWWVAPSPTWQILEAPAWLVDFGLVAAPWDVCVRERVKSFFADKSSKICQEHTSIFLMQNRRLLGEIAVFEVYRMYTV